jgi:hypothetical protein
VNPQQLEAIGASCPHFRFVDVVSAAVLAELGTAAPQAPFRAQNRLPTTMLQPPQQQERLRPTRKRMSLTHLTDP